MRKLILLLLLAMFLLMLPASADTDIGYISVTSSPRGGQIYIDGKYIADTSATAEAKPGTHLVTIQSPEYFTWSDEVTVESGETTNVDATLLFYKSPGSLGVTSSMPAVEVYIDDMYYASVQSGTITIPNLSPQLHEVKVVKAGYYDFITTVQILSDKIVGVYSDQKRDTTDSGLRIKSDPHAATVFLDNNYIGTTLTDSQWLQESELDPGSHTINVYKDGYSVWTTTETFTAGDVTSITANLSPVPIPTETTATPLPVTTEATTYAPPAPTQSPLASGGLVILLLGAAVLLARNR